MITAGTYKNEKESYQVILKINKSINRLELLLIRDYNIVSAYLKNSEGEFSYHSNEAKKLWGKINSGAKKCNAKNARPAPFVKGTVSRHEFTDRKTKYVFEKYCGEIVGVEINNDKIQVYLEYTEHEASIPEIPYIKIGNKGNKNEFLFNNDKDNVSNEITVRTLEEISLDGKDITWLKNKQYYIVNDDESAENLLSLLDKYKGKIAFDTETSGLKINMFGAINSEEARILEEYNRDNDNPIKVDHLVGIIFCVEKNVSYYLPCKNRKFKNLFEDKSSIVREKILKGIKVKYTIGEQCLNESNIARYFRETPDDEIRNDVILMERCRNILEKGEIITHGGSFDWKVAHLYGIDVNITDDTMILHQMLYKFRDKSQRGESSKLKYLTLKEFGVDQLDLSDFFRGYKEDDSQEVRKNGKGKKKDKSEIDFSYMDYEGARCYGAADGDFTFQLYIKYKSDLIKNHENLIYLYNVEIIVACAVGYMEFYGHKFDVEKIESTRKYLENRNIELEYEIRKLAGICCEEENKAYDILQELIANKASEKEIEEAHESLSRCIKEYGEELNLASPKKVADLFYKRMGIEYKGDKFSVAVNVLKQYINRMDADGNYRYIIMRKYSEHKSNSTLITKFFGRLTDFMYPGGFVFSSYGQISTATGRMSCSKPNAQQYPKVITGIVVPRENNIHMDADYSQIEYRTLVALAKELELIESFKDPDNDYHTKMASLMFNIPYDEVKEALRTAAKRVNFGIIYGMGIKSLAINLHGVAGPKEIEDAKEKRDLYYKDQPNVKIYLEQVKEKAVVNKYSETLWHRKRIYDFTDKDGQVSQYKIGGILRQAGNAVIQGTAADIYKIAIARIFMYIRSANLYGLLFITNMIHDEVLLEINYKKLNIERVFADILDCMQYHIDGFPPIFVGAGFGSNWKSAKSKEAEIHPYLADMIREHGKQQNILGDNYDIRREDILNGFSGLIKEYRIRRVREFLTDMGDNMYVTPFIQGLLALDNITIQEFINTYMDEETQKKWQHVIIKDGLMQEEDDIEFYEDEENGDNINLVNEDEIYGSDFELIEETDEIYNVSISQLIKTFGLIVSKDKRVCGIDTTVLSKKVKGNLLDFLTKNQADKDEEEALQVVFLREGNTIFNTGVYVKGINGAKLSRDLDIDQSLYV